MRVFFFCVILRCVGGDDHDHVSDHDAFDDVDDDNDVVGDVAVMFFIMSKMRRLLHSLKNHVLNVDV